MNDAARRRTVALTAAAATAIGAAALFAATHRHSPRHATEFAEPSAAAPAVPDSTTAAEAAPSAEVSATPLAASTHRAPLPPDASVFDEAELMRLLRSARDNDAALAVELAREGNRRFPTSPDAPERASILIHALSDQGLNSEARGEAEDMVNRYPDSSWVQEIERFTGAHRHRNVRVDDQGQLRFYDPPPS